MAVQKICPVENEVAECFPEQPSYAKKESLTRKHTKTVSQLSESKIMIIMDT